MLPRFAFFVSFVALGLSGTCSALAQGANLPWGASSDSLAWATLTQVAAPSVNPSTPGVEFETWASDSDIYRTSPPQWPTAGSPKVLQISALGASHLRRGLMPEVIAPSECLQAYNKQAAAAAGFPADGCIGEEVRRNCASFRYIVSNSLHSVAGLKAAYANGLTVNLPADAIEVKGDWARVEDARTGSISAKLRSEAIITSTKRRRPVKRPSTPCWLFISALSKSRTGFGLTSKINSIRDAATTSVAMTVSAR